jgi:hypothetical protein
MDVTASIELSESEQKRLAAIIGCEMDELAERLAPYAGAALEEYVRMFLGQRAFARGSDIREYRLLLLIQKAHGGNIPDEANVSALFQTTSGQSRGLIRAVLSKFQYDLEGGLRETLKAVLEAAEWQDDGRIWTTIIHSSNVVDALNREAEATAGDLPPVVKSTGTMARFEIKPSTYQRLRERLGLSERAEE